MLTVVARCRLSVVGCRFSVVPPDNRQLTTDNPSPVHLSPSPAYYPSRGVPNPMRRLIFPVLLALATAAFAQKHPATIATDTATTAAATTTTTVISTDSRQVRKEFNALLPRVPPDVGVVLKLDPTLFNNQQYLATYPELASFVSQHPDISHNPGFYLSDVWVPGEERPRLPSQVVWDKMMEGFMILTIFGTITGVVVWLIRTLVEQRRWSRLSRVQTEVHGKVLERLTSNDELLRYIEPPAGRRFLESAPTPVA